MRVVFCIYNFVDEKLPLQPWLTIHKVAEGLVKKGHEVHVVTDVMNPAKITGITSHAVSSLRGSNKVEMRSMLEKLQPDALVFLPTPLNIATTSWLDGLNCRCVGFASYPFYNASELITALKIIGWAEAKQYIRHLLVPRLYWARKMQRRIQVLVTQSNTTASRLAEMLKNKLPVLCIPPGIDLNDWPVLEAKNKAQAKDIQLLYLGSAISIRGFYLALDALTQVANKNVRLKVLARGAHDEAIEEINNAISIRGLNERVVVRGGWIERAELVREIHRADAVLQPFVLVPSELPVTAMEVIACGTPVIGSNIDGLPSTIGAAGTVAKQGCSAALAEVIEDFAKDPELREKWQTGCEYQRNEMLDWDEVTDKWETILRG